MEQQDRIKKSLEKLEQTLDEFQGFYTQAINKTTQFFSLLKNNLSKFYTSEFKSINSKNIKIKILEGSFKFWKTAENQLSILEFDALTYDPIKKQYIQAMKEFKEMQKQFKFAKKDTRELDDIEQKINRELKKLEDPIIFYNRQQKIKHKKLISQIFSSYKKKKSLFNQKQKQKSRVSQAFFHLKDNLIVKSAQGLLKFNHSLEKFQEEIESIISRFYSSIMDVMKKLLKKSQIQDFQFQFTFDRGDFQKDLVLITSKGKQLTKQEIQTFYVKSLNFSKVLGKSIEEYLKLNILYEQHFKNSIQEVQYLKKSIELELNELSDIRIEVNDVFYQKNYNFIRSYKAILHSIFDFSQQTILLHKQIVTQINNHREISDRKTTTIDSLRRVIGKTINLDYRKLTELYNTINQALNILQQIEKDEYHTLKNFFRKNIQFYYNQINIKKESLKQFHHQSKTDKFLQQISLNTSKLKSINSRKSDLSGNEERKYLLEMQKLIRKRFNLEEEQILPKQNQKNRFEDKIQKMLETEETLIQITEAQKKYEKAYSCALGGGAILLVGKIKIYKDKVLFESSFNKKNIFFGSTAIIICKEDILSIRKDINNSLHNALIIETRKGDIFINSLYSRIVVENELKNIIKERVQINNQPQQILPSSEMDNKNKMQEDLQKEEFQKSMISELPDVEQLYLITQKHYDGQLFQPLHIKIINFKLEGINLKNYFRQFWHNKEINIKNQKYYNFKTYYLARTQNFEIKCTDWNPLPPPYFSKNSDSKFSDNRFSYRQMTYKHELPKLPIPFLPKYGNCIEKEKIYWISLKQFIIQTQSLMTGAPCSDTFNVNLKYIVTEEQNGVTIDITANVVFIKSTIFQAPLRVAAEKQLQRFSKCIKGLVYDHFNIFLAIKEKKKKKAVADKLNKIQPNIVQEVQLEEDSLSEQQILSSNKSSDNSCPKSPEIEILNQKLIDLQKKHRKQISLLLILSILLLIISHIFY